MVNKLLLFYLRNFPVNYGKSRLTKYVKLPVEKENIKFKSSGGVIFYLDINDYVMRTIYLMGMFERNTMRHVIKMLKPGMVFVDVGANIGAYTLILSKLMNEGKTYSFEPNPRTIAFLKRNIDANKLQNVNVISLGLSDREEMATLNTSDLTRTFTGNYNLGHASINNFDPLKHNGESIKLTTLDKFCSENNINNIDILKIDVEGHEKKCLDGATEIIEKSKNIIIIMEIDDNCYQAGYKKEFLYNYIIDKGFVGFLPKPWPFSMKKIISFDENYSDNIIFIKQDRA